jgi:hypothetical protein
MLTVGLFVRLEAKPRQGERGRGVPKQGLELANQEGDDAALVQP